MKTPFMGEMMNCALCSAKEKSDPSTESDWRLIELEGVGYYVCRKHFPEDRGGKMSSAGTYKKAYMRVLLRLAKIHRARRGNKWITKS